MINEVWKQEQDTVFNDLKGKYLWFSRDGSCKRPGQNPKHSTYTMIDQNTDKIVDFKVVQVSEVTSSNAMEREGFPRCMESVRNCSVIIELN